MKFIAATNLSSENSSTEIGGGPNPLALTRSPQKGWSPKNGTIVVGHCSQTKWTLRDQQTNKQSQERDSMKKKINLKEK